MKKALTGFLALVMTVSLLNGQGYLHTKGKYIVDGSGHEIILRGIGTGNWMLQEGYMMQSSDIAGAQHEFESLLIDVIGENKKDSFYTVWLQYHFTEVDVDSMHSWGFNSLRVAMHYKWFTPPIEDEHEQGKITWFDRGFNMTDSVLKWCSDNNMYLILDMHGAPGGQGYETNISDYDPSKPSLWESEENKNKLVALWKKLAERYKTAKWIGGYDLINETNWNMSGNEDLRDLYGRITSAIREVDTNHIIFIEGNWFANDFDGLTPPWDDNMVYSFHKYWSYNYPNSLDWVLGLREEHDIPLWLGETGENSNTWFTNVIELCETNHIGWAMWPVKKPGLNNVLKVTVNKGYSNFLERANTIDPLPSEEVFDAVLEFAKNHKIENCKVQKDVIDAMIRQPHTTETIPFIQRDVNDIIYAVDYDLGKNNFAYYDQDTANYHLDQGGNYINWNQGNRYRNDGVDIEECNDTDTTNGYNVGWTNTGEWLNYTLDADSSAAYAMAFRYAANGEGAAIRIEIEGMPVTKAVALPETGGWQNWSTIYINDIIIPEGKPVVKIIFENGGANFNYFRLTDPKPLSEVTVKQVDAQTSADGKTIILTLNKAIDSTSNPGPENFIVMNDSNPMNISEVGMDTSNYRKVTIILEDSVYYGNNIVLDYDGTTITSNNQALQSFNDFPVKNNLPLRHSLPVRIQAEDFFVNNGFELEACEDVGAGLNTAYAHPGDYLDYRVYVPESGYYSLNYRVATIRSNADIVVQVNPDGFFKSLDTLRLTSTNGWQQWETQSTRIYLEGGRYTLRLYIKQGEQNLNWFELVKWNNIEKLMMDKALHVFPNPTSGRLNLLLSGFYQKNIIIQIYDISGTKVYHHFHFNDGLISIDPGDLHDGIYHMIVNAEGKRINHRIMINR